MFNFDTRWQMVLSFKPQPLYPSGNNLQYPLDLLLVEPQSRAKCHEEKKNLDPSRGSNSGRKKNCCLLSYTKWPSQYSEERCL
jgi:hypothetical protein